MPSIQTNLESIQLVDESGKEKLEKTKKVIWRTQDWFWLTGILITIIIFIICFRLSDNLTFMNIFSFMANGIAIALAFVAMFTSFKQGSDNQNLTTQMSETLARMDEKINSMGQKVSDFGSIDEVKRLLEARLNKATESIEETLSEEDGIISKEDVMEILNSEMSSFSTSLEKIVQQNFTRKNETIQKNYGYEPDFNISVPKKLVRDTIETEYDGKEFTLKEIKEKVLNIHQEDIPLKLLRLILLDLQESNIILKVDAVRDNDGKLLSPYKFKENPDKKRKSKWKGNGI